MNLEKIKKYIPNTLTISRIILTPVIMTTFLTNNFLLTLVLATYSMTTDFLDGYLSRKWHVTSKLGALLDQIADKILGIGALLISLNIIPLLTINLILEVVIADINVISKFNGYNPKTLFSGKVKTWGLSLTLISSIATKFIPELSLLSNILSIITIVLQSKAYYDYYQEYNLQEKSNKNKNINIEKKTLVINENKQYNTSKTNNKTNDINFLKKLRNSITTNNDNTINKTKQMILQKARMKGRK